MTRKLIYFGTLERLKIYAGILVLYLLFFLVSSFGGPLLDVEILDTRFDLASVPVLGIAVLVLAFAELILFVRDFYTPSAYLLFSLPVKGIDVIGSRFTLFLQGYLLLIVLDLPFRVALVRAFLSVLYGEMAKHLSWLTASDMRWLSAVMIIAGILIFTLLPLITYLLIATAKCIFDLNSSWLVFYVIGGFGVILLLGFLISLFSPQLIDMPHGAQTYTVNWILLLPLVLLNIIFFWAASWVIDRKLNI
jgi:hypothetical protein